MTFSPAGIIGKASAADDYRLLQATTPPPPKAAEDVACEWLQRLLESSRSARCAVWQRLDGLWWLIRMQREAATDAVGRPRAFAWLACAGPTLDPLCAFNALHDSALGMAISRDAPPPTVLATEPSLVPLDREELAHALAAACGESITVRRIDLATAVLSMLAPESFQWLGFFPDDALRPPPGMQGVVLAKQLSPCDSRYYDLVDLCGVKPLLDLSLVGLRWQPIGRDEKLRLVRVAFGKEQLPAGATLATESIPWLARTPDGRRAALAAMTAPQVGEWLRSPYAEFADLTPLRDRLTDACRGDVVRLLSVRPEGFGEYAALYPNDAEGLFRLLAPAHQATYHALDSGQTPHPTAVAALWNVVGATALRRTFSRIAQIVSATAGVPAAREDLATTISFDGWPLSVARALLLGEQMTAAPTTAPPVSASSDWLAAVDGAALAACEPWAVADAEWRTWWLASLEVLARDGRMPPQMLFDIGVRLRNARLAELGAAPPAVVAVIRGVGALQLPLDRDAWHPAADSLVAAGIRDGSFWSHVTQPLEPQVLDWIAARLHERSDQIRLGELRRALDEGRPLPLDALSNVALRLTRRQLLGQISGWAVQPGGRERRRALEFLLGEGRFDALESKWLRAQTLELTPLPAGPAWSASDLAALLPILDPVRDVLRPVFCQAHVEPGEDELLTRIESRLRLGGVAAPPPPTPEQARRRSEWVQRLAALPGWSSWSVVDVEVAWRTLQQSARDLLDTAGTQLSGPRRATLNALSGRQGDS